MQCAFQGCEKTIESPGGIKGIKEPLLEHLKECDSFTTKVPCCYIGQMIPMLRTKDNHDCIEYMKQINKEIIIEISCHSLKQFFNKTDLLKCAIVDTNNPESTLRQDPQNVKKVQ